MRFTIAQIGNHETVSFAARELKRLIGRMDSSLTADIRIYDKFDPELKKVIWVGLDGSVERSLDETVSIKVIGGEGIITGSNECAVLIGVYRFMYELGCRFIRPGADGEKIPERSLSTEDLNIEVFETPSYRHRAVCIEGAVSFDHVYNMVDWLPKVGMSGYFIQFFTPSTFFKRYYKRFYENPSDPDFGNELTDDAVDGMMKVIEKEIALRSLKFHAVGHGWTCVPFGIQASGWEEYTKEVPEETRKLFAELKGERAIYKNPLDTNLCYSNPEVQERMTDAMVDYCKANPAVNYLHFWMADGSNNHCECENCRKKLPSDFYVQMLNLLDKKLTAAGIETKIVCLIYVDLLWEPQEERIENPDRFVLMFAPITRTYSAALNDFDKTAPVELAPYKRNENKMPASVAENVLRLNKWQETHLADDSFDFDYHLMWDHHYDPGYYNVSKLLHKDMCELELIGLNGMVSCQLQRTAFPTALPIYAMAKGLWDKESKFEDVSAEYFAAAFGEDGEKVRKYLSDISDLFDPVFLRANKKVEKEVAIANIEKAKALIKEFSAKELSKKANTSPDWKYLQCHAEMVPLFADALIAKLNESEDWKLYKKIFDEIVDKNAHITDTVLDDYFIKADSGFVLNRHPQK